MTDLKPVDDVRREEAVTDENEWWEETWGDWWSSDRLDAMGWAALFMWGALVVVTTYTNLRDDFDWWNGWGVFFVGAGVIVLCEAVLRLVMIDYRSKFGWTLAWGAAFLAIGLGELASPAWYALPLAAIAVLILWEGLTRRN